jgi:hypothetical protein
MLTPKVIETVRLSPHRRPTMSAVGRRHGVGLLSAH